MLPQSGTRDRFRWIYIIITIIIVAKNNDNVSQKIKWNTEHFRRHLIFFPNKRLLSNAVLPNSTQGAIIEFSSSTPEQWTEQTNEMPKADENLVSEAPMGHGLKHWED